MIEVVCTIKEISTETIEQDLQGKAVYQCDSRQSRPNLCEVSSRRFLFPKRWLKTKNSLIA